MSRLDEYRNRKMKEKLDVIKIIFVASLLLIAGLLCSCRTPSAAVPVTNMHENIRDSVRTEYVHDSVYIDRWHIEYAKGDTFYIRDSVDRWREKLVIIHDSIDNSRVDSIPVIVEIEKQGSVFLQRSGIALWVIIALIILGVVVGIIIKVAK